MDKLEYIPGDLVMVKESALQFAKDKIFKVISSLSGGFLNVVMLNDSSTTYSISNNAIRPIPLTPDILEKNGWKRIFREYLGCDNVGIFWLNENIGDCAEFEEFNRHFSPKIFKLPNIHYIHQQQHYFFGLNIKIKIEV